MEPTFPVLSGRFFTTESPGKLPSLVVIGEKQYEHKNLIVNLFTSFAYFSINGLCLSLIDLSFLEEIAKVPMRKTGHKKLKIVKSHVCKNHMSLYMLKAWK